jgi:signal peptidase I
MTAGPSPQPDSEESGPATATDLAEKKPESQTSRVARSEARKDKKRRGPLGFLRELPALLVVAFVLALLIKTFLVQAFYIPSASMDPTLKVGDRVLVNKVVYHIHPPRRGDIIVFAEPHPLTFSHRSAVSGFWHWLTEGLGVSTSEDKDFIKRVIGVPGDTVKIVHGQLFVNDEPLKEAYLNSSKDFRDFGPITVEPGKLFVLGDNRNDSNDSRFTLGMVPLDKVIGRAFVTIWPPSRVRWLHRQ